MAFFDATIFIASSRTMRRADSSGCSAGFTGVICTFGFGVTGIAGVPGVTCGLDAGVYRGHDEIREFWQRLLATFDEIRIELADPVEVEDGLVVAENVARFRGRDGIEVQARSTWLIRLRDGKTTSFTLYQTKQDALEAAGLQQ